MNILLSTIGRRSYLADFFRAAGADKVIGTTDRHGLDSEFTVGLLNCDKCCILPSIKSPDYVDTVLELCKAENVKMISSLFDQDCHVLSGHLGQFRSLGVTPFLPSTEVSDICFDKVRTDRFLRESGFGSPETFTSVESFRASKIGFPVILKPRFGFASLNIFIARNERELAGCFDPDVHIIQEAMRGQEYSFDILSNLEGKVVSCVVKRKLKMRAGETDQAITVRDDRLLGLAVKVGESLGHTGPLDVDLFVSRDEVHILEFNPRFGGGYPLSHAAGARFPELMMDMACGNSPESIIGQYQENIVMMKGVQTIMRPLESLLHDCQTIGRNDNE
jgi:carbamoyl-phosphate synthase large subunit